jgi:hypothetical protein
LPTALANFAVALYLGRRRSALPTKVNRTRLTFSFRLFSGIPGERQRNIARDSVEILDDLRG